MATPQALRRRLKSVQNTKQITRTMEMVSTSKLKRAQDRVIATRPYAEALGEVLENLYAPELVERFPLLRRAVGGENRVALVGITSNRGLCGAFNANLIKKTRERMAELTEAGAQIDLHLVGRKGAGFFRYIGQPIASAREDIGDKPKLDHAIDLIAPLIEQFEEGELDAVEIIFAKFNSAISTPPTVMRVLPVEPPEQAAGDGDRGNKNYILRPSAEEIVGAILPLYVRNAVFRALVETAAAEHGARRTAMKNATDSAGDMIDLLRRQLNRARQAKITQEIAEIVGGADALEG